MRLKIMGSWLISVAAAWVLSGWLVAAACYLFPVYLDIQIKSGLPQRLMLFTSKEDRFSLLADRDVIIKTSPEFQTLHLPVPRHRASHLRVGFWNGKAPFYLADIRLNGHPLDFLAAYAYQPYNMGSCDRLQTGEMLCVTAGENASVTFPSAELAAAVQPVAWIWRYIVFLFCLAGCWLISRRYGQHILRWVQKNYSTWLIGPLLVLLVYAYYAMRWQVFTPRLSVVFSNPSWLDFPLFAQEQAWVPAFLLGSFGVAFILKNKYLKTFLLALGFGVLFLEVLDSALLYLLNARFSPDQITAFGPDICSTAGPFIKSYFGGPAGGYTLLLGVVWLILAVSAYRHTLPVNLRKVVWVFAVMGFIWYLMPSALLPNEQMQLRDWPRLFLRTVLPHGNKLRSAGDFRLSYQCQDGLNSGKNVIIIIVESLSSYMSDYFSGGQAENWTPQLDKLARKYVAFTNHRAHNESTNQNLFSIFTGIPAIIPGTGNDLFRDPKFYSNTLAKVFHNAGYHTAFFTGAALVYSKEVILNRTGFDEISKDIDPFYNGHKRFVFHAVADDVLYAHAEKWIEDYNRPNPYLLVLKTTTSHSPFTDPISGEESLEKAVRYADKALGDFIADLERKHILDNTLVVITADHHIARVLVKKEKQIFGAKAEMSIPLILIGGPMKGPQNIPSMHIDLMPSLAYLTLPQACFHQYQQNLFSSPTTRDSCTLFQSSEPVDKVFVQCQDQEAKLSLSSEDEPLVLGQLPEDKVNGLLGFINWIRGNGLYN